GGGAMARLPPRQRAFHAEFEPGDLYLLNVNGASRVDFENRQNGLLIHLDVEVPHSFCFRSAEELYVIGGGHRGGLLGVFGKSVNRLRLVTDVLPRNANGLMPAAGCIVVDAQGNAYTPRFRDFGLVKITPDGRISVLAKDDSLLWGEPIAI